MSTAIKPPKLGNPLEPGDGNDATSVVVIEPRDDVEPGEFGSQVSSVGLTIDFNPEIIAAGMRDAWLKHFRQSTLTGQRVDGAGSVKKLGRRAAEAPGRQSDHRMYKTGTFADETFAAPMTSNGQTASVTIKPPRERVVIAAKERARGNNSFTTEGAAGAAALEGARLAVEAMMTGRKVLIKTGTVDAEDVKS